MGQGIFQLFYFTYLHNQLVIGLFLALVVAIFCLIRQPRRSLVFFCLGFAMLIIHFEYQKHIVDALAEQTVSTVFLEEGHYRSRWLTTALIYHFLPLVMWLVGWGSIILGLLDPQFACLKRDKINRKAKNEKIGK